MSKWNWLPGRSSRSRRYVVDMRDEGLLSRATYIGNNRLLLKLEIGGQPYVFYVEADDKLITPWLVATGRYDDASTSFFLRELKSNSNCLDVGANFGYFSCLMARRSPAGKIIGLEADEHISRLARDNLLINSLHDNGSVRHAAANDTSESLRLFRRVNRSGNTSIIHYGPDFTDLMVEPSSEEFVVQGMTIDMLLPELGGRIDFMKIDVEGAEPLVFRGASVALSSNPQMKIVMEWSPGQIQGGGFDVAEFLRDLDGAGLVPHTLRGDRPLRVSYNDLLQMPYQSGVMFHYDR